RLMGRLPRDGLMVAVEANEATVASLIAPWRDEISIAALNGPNSTVISGAKARVEAVAAELARAGARCTLLKVSHAFHSPLMKPMIADFEIALGEVEFSTPRIDLMSTVTGARIGVEAAGLDYWSRQVIAPVRFAEAIGAAAKS